MVSRPLGTISYYSRPDFSLAQGDEREIGNVNEGIVEGGEDTGNTENELACEKYTR